MPSTMCFMPFRNAAEAQWAGFSEQSVTTPLSPRPSLVELVRESEARLDAKTDGLPEELFLFVSRITGTNRVHR